MANSTENIYSQVGQKVHYEHLLDCVHCGLCLSACPTYLETGDENNGPRGRIYLMRSVIDQRVALDDDMKRHLDLCLDCRSCETACPSGVQYGQLIEPFRGGMHEAEELHHQQQSSWFRKWILLGMFPYPQRLRWALLPMRFLQATRLDRLLNRLGVIKLLPISIQRMYRLLPPLKRSPASYPQVYPAVGRQRARVALFTGCVAPVMFPQAIEATIEVLQHNGCEVVIPAGQVCCGAIHHHNGDESSAIQLAQTNVEMFLNEEWDAVISNVAGCGTMLKEYSHFTLKSDSSNENKFVEFSDKVKDISQFLSELGLIKPQGAVPKKVTYHDACHLCHAQNVSSEPREILDSIPELELVPLHESDICCGAAGSYNLTEPEMSDRLAERKRKNLLETGAEVVVSGNVGCTMQIMAAFKQSGNEIPVLHPVELLAESYRAQPE